MFSLRIVTVDHYLAPPIHPLDPTVSVFRGCEVTRVPVLRVFGVTHAGQKACLHVHGVFPYLCVPYDDQDEGCGQPAGKFALTLALELDRLLNAAAGKTNSFTQHVYNIEAISATPLYGYHAKEKTFLRISFYSPFIVRKAAELLLSGMVLNRIMQPHEAHIPYVLQFLVDHNLHGMNMLHVEKFKFRQMSLNFEAAFQRESGLRPDAFVWVLRDLPLTSFLDSKVDKHTVCELELDCCAKDILNTKEYGDTMNPGLSAIWEDERERKRERGETSSLCLPPSLDRDDVVRTESEMFYLRRLDKQLQAARPSSSRSQIGQLDLPPQEPTASAYPKGSANSNPDSSISESVILDTQDMSLVEMLARATANQSMTEDPSEDVDSILSLLPAPLVRQEDSEAEDEEEVTTREMSQVLDSEHEDNEVDAKTSILQECLRSPLSDWEDQDEIQRLPSQLDGTDDVPGSLRPETGCNKPSHQPLLTDVKANDIMSSCSSPSETPLVTDDEKEAADEAASCWRAMPVRSPEVLSASGNREPPLPTEMRTVERRSSCSSPSETPLVTDDEKDDDVGPNWKPPPLLSRRFLSCGNNSLMEDDSESSCTDVEMKEANHDLEPAKPEESRAASASPQPQCKRLRPGRNHRSTKLSLSARREKKTSEVPTNPRSSPRKLSSGRTDLPSDFSPSSMKSKDLSIQSPRETSAETKECVTVKVPSVSPKKVRGSEKGNDVGRGSKRSMSDACGDLDAVAPEQVKRKKREDEQHSKARARKHSKTKYSIKECHVILSRLSEECVKAWTEDTEAGFGRKPSPKKRSKNSVCRSKSSTESSESGKATTSRIQTSTRSKPRTSPSLQGLFRENEDFQDSDLDSIDLPKVVIDLSSEAEIEPLPNVKTEDTDADVAPNSGGESCLKVATASCSLEISAGVVHGGGASVKRVSSSESSTETKHDKVRRKRTSKANAVDQPSSEEPTTRRRAAKIKVTKTACGDEEKARESENTSRKVSTKKHRGESVDKSKEVDGDTKVRSNRKSQNVKEHKDAAKGALEARQDKHDEHGSSRAKKHKNHDSKGSTEKKVKGMTSNKHRKQEQADEQEPLQRPVRATRRSRTWSTDSSKDVSKSEEDSGRMKESQKKKGKKVSSSKKSHQNAGNAGKARKGSLSLPTVCTSIADFDADQGVDNVNLALNHGNSPVLENGCVPSSPVLSAEECTMDTRIWNLEYLPGEQKASSVLPSGLLCCEDYECGPMTGDEEAAAVVQSFDAVQDESIADNLFDLPFNESGYGALPSSSNETLSQNSTCLSVTQILESSSNKTAASKEPRRRKAKRRRSKLLKNDSTVENVVGKSSESASSQGGPAISVLGVLSNGSACAEPPASNHSETGESTTQLSGGEQLNKSAETPSSSQRTHTDCTSLSSAEHQGHTSDVSSYSSDPLLFSGSTPSKKDLQSLVSLPASSNSVTEEEVSGIGNERHESQPAGNPAEADVDAEKQTEANDSQCTEDKDDSNEEYLLDDDFLGFDSEQHWVIVDEVGGSEVETNCPNSPELFSSQEEMSDAPAEAGIISALPAEELSKATNNEQDSCTHASIEVDLCGQFGSEPTTEVTSVQDLVDSPCAEEDIERQNAAEDSETGNEALSPNFITGSQEDKELLDALVTLEQELNLNDQDMSEELRECQVEGLPCSETSPKDGADIQVDSSPLAFLDQELDCENDTKTDTQEDGCEQGSSSPPGSFGFECLLSDGLDSGDEIRRFYREKQLEPVKDKQEAAPVLLKNLEETQCSHVHEETDNQFPGSGGCEGSEETETRREAPGHDSPSGDLPSDALGLSESASLPPCEDVKGDASCAEDMDVTPVSATREPEDANDETLVAPQEEDVSFDSTLRSDHSRSESGVHSFYIDASIAGDNTHANSPQSSSVQQKDIPPAPETDGLVVLTPLIRPPSHEEVNSSLETYGLPSCVPLQPFCSRPADGPVKSASLQGEGDVNPLEIFNSRKKGMLRSDLPGWQQQIAEEYSEIKNFPVDFVKNPDIKVTFCSDRTIVLTPVILPPSNEVVGEWIAERKQSSGTKEDHVKSSCDTVPDACWDSDGSCIPSRSSDSRGTIIKQSTPFMQTKLSLGKKPKLLAMCAHQRDSSVGQDASPSGSSLLCDLSPVPGLVDTTDSKLRRDLNLQTASPVSSRTAAVTRKRLLDCGVKKHQSLNTSSSQLDGPTRSGLFNFKLTGDMRKAKDAHQMLTVMSAEVHVRTRGDLRPDPSQDPVLCIFYCFYHDIPDAVVSDESLKETAGAIVVGSSNLRVSSSKESQGKEAGLVRDIEDLLNSPDHSPSAPSEDESSAFCDSSPSQSSGRRKSCNGSLFLRSGVTRLAVLEYVALERELFDALVRLVRKWDPDILVGFEIQMLSWGYLLQRASCLGVDLHVGLSRAPTGPSVTHVPSSQDGAEADASHATDVMVTGRVVLNLWRIMRKELTLNIYTFENVYFHVMHQRIPLYAFKTLTDWFDHETDLYRWRVVEHYVTRACGSIRLLNRLDIIGKTSEMARIFGIQFFEVLSRGSQFRVESMMLRSARQRGMVAVSPSVQQRARMRAPEWIPLVMEPVSHLYTSPVVVLDFQSLYPSIMIAYNYCFSTCLGRVDCLGSDEPFVFGCTSLSVGTSLLNIVRKYITVSPAGVAFVLPPVRKGVLPQMLEEILSTRIMVKQAMKEYKQNKALTRVLDARQLGLKLIANVTYGYTAASYSGRMSCVEVADSIVSKGRETLERAIRTVEGMPRWGAKVIYGDTDSLFVLLEGKTKRQAFEIGHEIAEVVTAQNPKPVKLKFEKVYLPCVLQTKKRYVGFAYESQDQLEPTYDAKGIETVRRDGCPAVSKILEKSLRILFRSRDVSAVKHYVKAQFGKILSDKVNMQDFIFAKEYRGMAGYKPGACVPALEISRRLLQKDPRAEPRVGERVPYIVVYGSPGMRLIQLVRHVREVLDDPSARLNTHYYITRVIAPALNRVFGLVGTDVLKWYSDLPRPVQPQLAGPAGAKGSICRYLVPQACPACKRPTARGEALCSSCKERPQYPAVVLGNKARKAQRAQNEIQKMCCSCMGFVDKNVCISLDCPVLYRAIRADREAQRSLSWNDINAVLAKEGKTKV